MLDASDTPTLDTSPAGDSVSALRDLIERLQAQVKFEQTRNEALNFEIARLKRWRFGSSSESLETSTQAVLFDQILADTALEDRAAQQDAGERNAEGVGKHAPFAEQLPRHLMHRAAVVFDEHPNTFVGLQMFRQFEIASASSGGLPGGRCVAHRKILVGL